MRAHAQAKYLNRALLLALSVAVDNDTYAVTLMIIHAVGGSTVSVKVIAGESPSSEELISFQPLLLWFCVDFF